MMLSNCLKRFAVVWPHWSIFETNLANKSFQSNPIIMQLLSCFDKCPFSSKKCRILLWGQLFKKLGYFIIQHLVVRINSSYHRYQGYVKNFIKSCQTGFNYKNRFKLRLKTFKSGKNYSCVSHLETAEKIVSRYFFQKLEFFIFKNYSTKYGR